MFTFSKQLKPADYDAARDSAEAWAATAHELREAAAVLWAEVEKPWEEAKAALSDFGAGQTDRLTLPAPRPLPWRAALMLSGFAVENYLKALVVSGKLAHSPIKGTLKRSDLTGHDLGSLAALANLSVSPAEADLLRGLSEGVVWAGRYPIAKDASKTPQITTVDPGVHQAIGLLVGRLTSELRARGVTVP